MASSSSSMCTGFYIFVLIACCQIKHSKGFAPGLSHHSVSAPILRQRLHSQFRLFLNNENQNAESNSEKENNSEAERLRQQAAELRQQIRNMEDQLGDKRARSYQVEAVQPVEQVEEGMTLKRKRVLVVGANGRLGSMVCRNLLRNNPETEVVAAVHYVSENSSTSRGYGRLSYEVGAEDGVGRIGPAWSSEDRTATFEYADYMKDYNLKNLRIVECELLDPVQCMSIAEGCDAVVWCATDFNGNQPRALGLDVAFLFRAIAVPDKGRVEVEGLQNMLGALKNAKQEKKYRTGAGSANDPVAFVLVSTAPDAFEDFETPFGSFKGIKQQGETMLKQDFPSLTHTVLRMGRFDDSFVEENLDVYLEESGFKETEDKEKTTRLINRRDAAKAVVQALTSEGIAGKTVEVWTAER